jgi:acyl-CoA thioesterase-1
VLLAAFLQLASCDRETPPARRHAVSEEPAEARPILLFLGDSLTFGYGLSPEDAYPARIEEKLADEGLEYEVVNAGVSGDTTASGLRRLDWLLQREPAVLVLALGGNDGLRGIPVGIVLAGMQAPPNMGFRFAGAFRRIFPELAEENDLPLVPFLLEGVAGDPRLNLGDGIHPNAAGQAIVAENVWDVLEPLLSP